VESLVSFLFFEEPDLDTFFLIYTAGREIFRVIHHGTHDQCLAVTSQLDYAELRMDTDWPHGQLYALVVEYYTSASVPSNSSLF